MQFEQCTLDEVSEAMGFLDAGMSRHDWAIVGMAIKSEFGEGGQSTFDDWSAGSDKYDKDNIKSSWRSFKQSGRNGSVSIATLFKQAIDAGYKPKQQEFSEEEKQKRQQEYQARRVLREKEAIEEQRLLGELQLSIAKACQTVWENLPIEGESDYLKRKQVAACGARFVGSSFMFVVDLVENRAYVLTERDEMTRMAAFKKAHPDDVTFFWLKKGAIVLPMFDMQGTLWSLQFILANGTKLFIKNSMKSDTCFLIGEVDHNGHSPICLAEGFATGASVYMATGYPVFVCWDAGNLKKIAPQVREAFPDYEMLICGDNDVYHKETKALNENNEGLLAATHAAREAMCGFVVPFFNPLGMEDKVAANA